MDFYQELKRQREMALNTLKSHPSKNSPHLKGDRTEYSESNRYTSFNISDLAGQTIEIQTPPPAEKPTTKPNECKPSFHPSEINARSTMNIVPAGDQLRSQNPGLKPISTDVEEILATSTCANIRKLRDSLFDGSLPRTADMSFMSSVDSLASAPAESISFWNIPAVGKKLSDESLFGGGPDGASANGEEFLSADKASNRLLEDEKLWEQEFADIPQTDGAEGRQTPVFKAPLPKKPEQMNFTEFSAILANDETDLGSQSTNTNFSIGQYFNKMSAELGEMVSDKSPPTRGSRVPLVDITDQSLTDTDLDESQYKLEEIKQILSQMSAANSPVGNITKMENLTMLYNKLKQMNLDSNSTLESSKATYSVHHHLADTLNDSEPNLSKMSDRQPMKTFAIPPSQSKMMNIRAMAVDEDEKRLAFSKETPKLTINDHTVSDFEEDKENTRPEIDQVALRKSLSKILESKKRPHSPDPRQDVRPAAIISQKFTEPFEMIGDTPKSSMPLKRKQPQVISAATPVQLTVPMIDYVTPTTPSPPGSPNRTPTKNRRDPFELTSSPSKRRHLLDEKANDRFYVKSPTEGDAGKFSLPSYGLARNGSASTPIVPITRTSSQCSTGSEFSHRDGTIPLKATSDEISWGSVKLRKNSKKSIQIKNTSSKRLCLKAVISGPGFQMASIDLDEAIVLQGHECRSITVTFCPTVIGGAVGFLKFVPSKDTAVFYKLQGVESVIKLFGYGGHVLVDLSGVYFPPSGLPFLPMGHVRELVRPLERTFHVHNRGNIPAFLTVMIAMKGVVDRSNAKCLKITPSKTTIQPGATKAIHIKFAPSHAQLRKLCADKSARVFVITNLMMLYGDEPTRQRLRHRVKDLQHLNDVCAAFPGEPAIDDLHVFKESLQANLDELYDAIRQQELILTVDRFADESLINLTGCTDQSSLMFKTLCSAVVSDDDEEEAERLSQGGLTIQPARIVINPEDKLPFQLFLTNNRSKPQFFQVDTSVNRQFFQLRPTSGTLVAGETRPVHIELRPGALVAREKVFVVVYLENEKFHVPLHISKEPMRR